MSHRDTNSPATPAEQAAITGPTSIGIALLALASGSLDVIAFLSLGRVFASAMTGNTALLGIALSDGHWASAVPPALALGGFVVGASMASVVFDSRARQTRQAATLRSLLLGEVACLVVFAIVWQRTSEVHPGTVQYLLILLCSFSMGVQGIAAKVVGAPGVNTIVFTSTVVEIVYSVSNFLIGREQNGQVRSDTLRQVASFAAYAVGAVVAGLLAWSEYFLLAWLPVAAVLLAFVCFTAGSRRGVG